MNDAKERWLGLSNEVDSWSKSLDDTVASGNITLSLKPLYSLPAEDKSTGNMLASKYLAWATFELRGPDWSTRIEELQLEFIKIDSYRTDWNLRFLVHTVVRKCDECNWTDVNFGFDILSSTSAKVLSVSLGWNRYCPRGSQGNVYYEGTNGSINDQRPNLFDLIDNGILRGTHYTRVTWCQE